MRRNNFEQFEHTADIGIIACGDSLAEAFEIAGEALTSLMIGDGEVAEKFETSIELESVDREGLLVALLSHMLLLFDAENMVVARLAVDFRSGNTLNANFFGEEYDAVKHGEGHHVKGVSYHMMEIHDADASHRAKVKVLFDV